MQRGMISSLNDRGKVTDKRQSRFSQNQFTPSAFIITDPSIIKMFTVNGGTSFKFIRCFIYLCSNRSKRKSKINRLAGKRGFQFGKAAKFPVSFAGDAGKEGGTVPFRNANAVLWAQTGGPELRSVKLLTFATGCYTADLPVVSWRGTDCDLRASHRHPCVTFRCRRGNSGESGIPARPTTQNRPRPFRWENSRG
jgi:hypothetical protein